MHVVAEVGDDEREIGQRAPGEVSGEGRERDDGASAASLVAGDVVVIEERVMFLRIVSGRGPEEAGGWHPLEIGLPGEALRLQLIGQVLIPKVEPPVRAR